MNQRRLKIRASTSIWLCGLYITQTKNESENRVIYKGKNLQSSKIFIFWFYPFSIFDVKLQVVPKICSLRRWVSHFFNTQSFSMDSIRRIWLLLDPPDPIDPSKINFFLIWYHIQTDFQKITLKCESEFWFLSSFTNPNRKCFYRRMSRSRYTLLIDWLI